MMDFTFGPVEFTTFFREKHERLLKVLVWYKTADGRNKYVECTVDNTAAEKRHEALEDALRYVTPFVRERWFLVEVTTLTVQEYGRLEGGYGRLRAIRSVEPKIAPDTTGIETTAASAV